MINGQVPDAVQEARKQVASESGGDERDAFAPVLIARGEPIVFGSLDDGSTRQAPIPPSTGLSVLPVQAPSEHFIPIPGTLELIKRALEGCGAALLSAEGGFGKTEASRAMARNYGGRVIWIEGQRGYVDELSLAVDIADRAQRALGIDLAPLLRTLNDPQIAESQLGRVPGRITEALAAALNELATEGLLVVDDVHELPPSLVKATVATLLRARPRHLKTLIITGAAESESLGKLVSEGKIRRIDRKCFQVDAALTAKYLLRRFDRTIPEPICQKLAVVTEGWPMALVLIDAEDVASDEALEALLQELEASPGRTYDVLLTRAYQRQDAAVQRVLKAISVSRRVTPEWLNSVLGTADGGATLRLLSTSNAFVLRSETSADDWRLQALFRTFLRQRLVDEEGEAARRRWFERSYGYWEQRSEYLTATW